MEYLIIYRYYVAAVFIIGLAFHDSRYSRMMAPLADYDWIKNLRIQAKIIKWIAGMSVLCLYGYETNDWDFIWHYLIMHLIGFDVIHSLFWQEEIKSFKWYLKHSIFVRVYEAIIRIYKWIERKIKNV